MVATPTPLAPVAPDLIVQDEIIVQFDPMVSLIAELGGRVNAGITGVAEVDAASRAIAVRAMRRQFPGPSLARQDCADADCTGNPACAPVATQAIDGVDATPDSDCRSSSDPCG